VVLGAKTVADITDTLAYRAIICREDGEDLISDCLVKTFIPFCPPSLPPHPIKVIITVDIALFDQEIILLIIITMPQRRR